MDGWGGFSDADLHRLKQQQGSGEGGALRPSARQPVSEGGATGAGGRGRHTGNNAAALRQQQQKRRQLLEQRQLAASVTSDQMLSRPNPPPPKPSPSPPQHNTANRQPRSSGDRSNDDRGTGGNVADKTESVVAPKDSSRLSNSDMNRNGDTDIVTSAKELDAEEAVSREMSHWEQFQTQQKQMEELNKRKRQLLASAIQKRQRMAKAESVKLTRLQQELVKMDQLLTVDVSVIRDRIEEASRTYLEAQKRYDRVEKELIEAKLDLHDKIELKDQLTEHLYTVINQNEIRKSKKLAELMDKLELDEMDDDVVAPPGGTCSMPAMIPAVEQAIVTHTTPKAIPSPPAVIENSKTDPKVIPSPSAMIENTQNSKTDAVVVTVNGQQDVLTDSGGVSSPIKTTQESVEKTPTTCVVGSADTAVENASGGGVDKCQTPSPHVTDSEVVQDTTEKKLYLV